jgi:hypothetical protein
MKKELKWTKYESTLEEAEKLYLSLYGEPKNHLEWAEKFNKVGNINKLIWEAIEKVTPCSYYD